MGLLSGEWGTWGWGPTTKRPWPHLSPPVSPFPSDPSWPQVPVSLSSCVWVGFGSSTPLGRSLPSLAVGRQPEAPRQPPGLLLPGGPASVPAVTMHEDEWHSCRGPEGMRWGRFGHCPLSQQPGIGWNH